MRFIIITGMSGAGKSHVIKYMEDLGFYCVDNIPPALIPKFAEICLQGSSKMEDIAMVIDIRGGELLKDFFPSLNALKESGIHYEIIFLEASDDVLIKRFKESRRAHPLAPEGRLIRAIKEERSVMQGIKAKSNHIVDTSNLSTKQLKEEIANIFKEDTDYEGLIISVISFGFKYGLPIDCDLVFDVRFIPNPYYIESMKRLSGKNDAVKDFVLNSSETSTFMEKLTDMLEFLIPNYIREGKSHLVIGIGCTGGRHRSVTIADSLHNILEGKQHRVVVEHRDIDKDNKNRRK